MVEPSRVALVGVRALDDGERTLIRELEAKVFTMSEVDRLGLERCIRESLAHIAGPGFVHVSLDMDAVDPASPRASARPCAAASPTARRTSRWS